MADENKSEIVEVGGKTYEMVYELSGRGVRGFRLQVIGDVVQTSWTSYPSVEDPSGFSMKLEVNIAGRFVEEGITLGVLGLPKTATTNIRLCLSPARSSQDRRVVIGADGQEGWPLNLAKTLRSEPQRGQFFLAWVDPAFIDEVVRGAFAAGSLLDVSMTVALDAVFVERKDAERRVIAEPLWIHDSCRGRIESLSFVKRFQALNVAAPVEAKDAVFAKALGRIWNLLLFLTIVTIVALARHWW